ncbi:CarD family transcriptional regulator [Sedimentibacter sp. zth1]|uniref:CarD family transcriptional regulator n=1 Tax=Sedimentibacter sp. zth1 TaxID=2816908 RepID=UPI001A92F359|nr:CarD family transcriptional regulator [Sedimentibacter sp. zth1]QSX07051.1 CarD family transcriptional regulator [Sedimentibacter sp. zth1]
MYNLGDKVVYPMHGAGKIESVEEKEILGEIRKYYILKMPIGEIKLMIPVDNVNRMGLRNIIDKDKVKEVLSVFEQEAEENTANWNKRYRENMEKMRTGDIFQLAHVVRDLAFRDKEKGLSTGEKKMLVNAKQMLISEIALSTDEDGIVVSEHLDDVIEKII